MTKTPPVIRRETALSLRTRGNVPLAKQSRRETFSPEGGPGLGALRGNSPAEGGSGGRLKP
ncbi:MAG: hypothetical protein LBT00_06860 [Spirochaetaceae bacterium]|nr:hypothetical protein [Spirochaetaceae bacterium]